MSLALFALSLVRLGWLCRLGLGLAACAGYYHWFNSLGSYSAFDFTRRGTLPGFVAAWLPNVVLVCLAIAFMKAGGRQIEST